MPQKTDPALRGRAVRLVLEHRFEHPSTAKAIADVDQAAKIVGRAHRQLPSDAPRVGAKSSASAQAEQSVFI